MPKIVHYFFTKTSLHLPVKSGIILWDYKGVYAGMKELSLLVWLTQLGLSTALPLAGFVLLGVWLHQSVGWGVWTIWAGLILGLICAVRGFLDSLKIMEQISKEKAKDPPPISFNEHD